MIACYTCRKMIAENAVSCPKCGAIQTSEGRVEGRRIARQGRVLGFIVLAIIIVPIIIIAMALTFGTKSSDQLPQPSDELSQPTSEQRGPASWDMDKLNRDAATVVNDPNKTIFVPLDGSQPKVVSKPDADGNVVPDRPQ